jgi:ureidoglycolate lyase
LSVSEHRLPVAPLEAAAFAPFGDVIEIAGRESYWINDHTCRRFADLAHIDVAAGDGRPVMSLLEASPQSLPLRIRALERHPLSSQAFFPLGGRPFLVVVAERGPADTIGMLRAFLSSGHQGVNYRRNTWHHPLIALGEISHFLVVDRGGPGDNCEERTLDAAMQVTTLDCPALQRSHS